MGCPRFQTDPPPPTPLPQRMLLPTLREYLLFFRREGAFLGYGIGLTFLSSFGQTFLLSLFVPFLLLEFDLDSGSFGTLYAAATLGSALLLPWAGRGLDRFPLPHFTLWVILGLAASALTLALAPGVGVLFVALVGLRLAGQSLAFQTALTAMARRYADDRGKALGIASLGLPIGEATLPVLIVAGLGVVGWRTGWMAIAGLSVLGFAPLLLLLLSLARPRSTEDDGAPEPPELRNAPPDHGARSWTRREILRDPRFWLILPAGLLAPFWSTGLFLYQTSLAGARGWSLSLVASAFGAFALTRVLCSLAAGGWVDRWSARRLFPWTAIPIGVALALLLLDGGWVPFAFMTALGLGAGLGGTVKGALWAELYGIRHLGAIKSMMAAFMVLATAAAPAILGVVADDPDQLDRLLQAGAGSVLLFTVLALRGLRGPALRADREDST